MVQRSNTSIYNWINNSYYDNKNDSFNFMLTFVFVMAAAINFLPLIMGYSLKDPVSSQYPAYLSEYNSNYFTGSLYASIGASAPLMMDYLLDMYYKSEKPSYYYLVPKKELFLALVIPDIFILAFVIPEGYYDIMPSLIGFRDSLYIFAFIQYMSKFGNKVWRVRRIILIPICFTASNILVTFNTFSTDINFRTKINAIVDAVITVGFLNFFIIYILWFKYIYYLTDNSIKNKVMICNVFAISFFIFLLGDWIIFYDSTAPPEWTNIGTYYLTMYTYLMAACTVSVSVIISKLSQIDGIDSKNQMLFMKKTFMRYISHEIRTPLSSIKMGLNILEKEVIIDHNFEKGALTIKELDSSCNDALEVLNDFLLSDKMENGLLKLEFQFMSLIPFINTMVNAFRFQVYAKNIDLKMSSVVNCLGNESMTIDKNLSIFVDQHQIKQVFRNIISNGIKFTPENGIIRIDIIFHNIDIDIENELRSASTRKLSTTTTREPCGRVRIKFTDSGAGVSKENQANLFQEYSQIEAGKLQQGGGSGLGLFISKKIMNMHNGDITFISEGEGQGSTVVVELDVFETIDLDIANITTHGSDDNELMQSSPSPTSLNSYTPIPLSQQDSTIESENTEIDQKYTTVLLVDDSKMNLKMLQKLLCSDFSNFLTAQDGLQGLEKVENCIANNIHIDLILMDYEMPKMNGLECIKAIRNKLNYKGLIIGLTGNALADDLNAMVSAGANHALTKPLETNLLFKLMSDYNNAV